MIGIIGNLNADLIFAQVRERPKFGHEYLVEHCLLRPGGIANMIFPLAKLGIKPLVVATLGRDFYGEMIYKEIAGLIEDGIIRTEKDTALSIGIVNEQAERFFITYRGNLDDLTYEAINQVKRLTEQEILFFYGYFLLPQLGHEGTKRALLDAKRRGQTTFFDANSDIEGWTEQRIAEILDLLPLIDYFMPNDEEASYLTGEQAPLKMLEAFRKYGANNVVIKCGESGAVSCVDGRVDYHPGFFIKPFDTTGAGDSFNAGYLYAYTRGFKPAQRLQFANALASIVVSRKFDRYPDLREIHERMIESNHNWLVRDS